MSRADGGTSLMSRVDETETGHSSEQPLVSIGLPVLDGEQFLSDALDSILAQDFDDYEVIVSDNGSADGTRAIAERYAAKDPRIRYVRHDRQRGASFNFNYVARAARGRYFKWVAHDDRCGPRFLSRCLEVLERDPATVLCYPRAVEIDATGAVRREFPAYDFAFEDGPSARVRSFLAQRPACLEAYGLMRRDVLLDTRMIGPFSSSDGVFLLEMMLRGRFARVDDFEFFCRKHAERSLVRYRASRRQWYDSGASAGRGFPEWRLTAELVRGVMRAPISRAEKWRSLGHVRAWAIANLPLLLRDVAAGVKSAVRMPRRGKAGRRARAAPPQEGRS